jgi:hypothetical protein
MYRAGMLAGMGFQRLAQQLVFEAMDLLSGLADEGIEEAANSIVTASHALATAGINISREDHCQ